MQRRTPWIFAPLALALVMSTGCASMHVLNRWSKPGLAAPIRSMLVVAIDSNDGNRQIMEDAFVRGLQRHGVIATASYEVWSEALPDTEAVRGYVRSHGVSGVLVAARMGVAEYKQVTSSYMPSDPLAEIRSWSGRYHHYFFELQHEATAGREVPHRVDVVQSDSRGGQMVWTALGKGVDPSSVDEVTREVSHAIVPEMAKAGVIPD